MPQPYPGQHWKHGWIPVTEAALRSKLKKGRPPRGKSPKITEAAAEAAAEAGAILRRMREQDAARRGRRSVTHTVDTRPSSRGESSRPAPTRTSSGGSRRPAAGRSTTAAGGEGTSRQADDAIRQAARRRTPAQQRTTERQAAPTTPEPRRQAASSRPTPQRQQPAPQPAAQAQPERRPPSVERAMDDIRETAAEIAPPDPQRPVGPHLAGGPARAAPEGPVPRPG